LKNRALQLTVCISFLCLAGAGWADHALLTSGKILYNVSVPDGATTEGSTLVRIRTSPGSFGYDPRTNAIYALPSYSISERLADYMKTNEQVGKAQAKNIFRRKSWDVYTPPAPQQRLVMPPPAPKQTPIPVAAQAVATPVPLNVVPANLPLDERLDQQLQIFMKEQTSLAHDAATSVVQGSVTPDEAKQRKLLLLEQQRRILQQFYPQTTDTVRLAIEYWGQQAARAQQTGKFDLENL
jgi:hypothetical protein